MEVIAFWTGHEKWFVLNDLSLNSAVQKHSNINISKVLARETDRQTKTERDRERERQRENKRERENVTDSSVIRY